MNCHQLLLYIVAKTETNIACLLFALTYVIFRAKTYPQKGDILKVVSAFVKCQVLELCC
jgi:hypothetical protein